VRAILLFLFFLSGFSALIYQVVWTRMLGVVFGVTSFAVATVLSAFMAGLALGSLYGGRFINERKDPLRVFAFLQICIGVFALLFPLLLSGLTVLYVLIYRQWPTSFYVFSLLRFALAFSVLLVPSTLMGATLPVLAKFFVRKLKKLGSDVGALYSVNNWGAVLGSLAAGFILMQVLGVRETSYLAAAISISVGLFALHLHRRSSRLPSTAQAPDPPVKQESATEGYPRYILHLVLWVFAIEGFTSLGYEVVWTRILASSRALISIHSYSLVVATFIAGLAIGSFLIRKYVDKERDLLILLAGIEIAIGVSALLLLPLFKFSGAGFIYLLAGRDAGWNGYMAMTAVWLGVLLLVPTTLMGATFPLVSRIYTVSLRELGRRIGKLGCLDTAGSILGAFAGGFVLIPLLGMQKSVLLLASINVLIGFLVIFSHPTMAWRRKRLAAALLVVIALAAYVFLPHSVRFVPRHFLEDPEGIQIVDYDEGVDATVVVYQLFTGNRFIAVNGVTVAGTSRMLKTTQITQAHLPLLLYEAHNGKPPERVLQVGLGTGHTSSSVSLHDLRDFHCVELVPAVLRAARTHFRSVNHGVFDDPRYRVFVQDARTFVLSSEEKYDVIMDDSVHPGVGGNASLYSRDFFRHCRERLSDNGVMSVWMPFAGLSADDVKMIFNAFQGAFPHATLWQATNDHNEHMVLIGTQRKLTIDFGRFRDRVQQPEIQRDLAEVDLDNVFVLLSCLLMDEQGLEDYRRGGEIHSDNHPYLAFSAPKSLLPTRESGGSGTPAWLARLTEFYSGRRSVLPYLTHLGNTDEEIARNKESLGAAFDASDCLARGFALRRLGRYEEAIGLAEAAQRLSVENGTCRYLLSLCHNSIARRSLRESRQRPDLSTAQRAELLNQAQKRCQQVIESDPQFPRAYVTLCTIHSQTGALGEAIRVAEEGLEACPDYPEMRLILAKLYAQTGMVQEAQAQLREFLLLFPGEPGALDALSKLGRI